ncbi:hypothetical protein PABG_12261 [Paracoccidioides brasiliensis Pb03]|nr:hypothetical protein PABG_12261 [Paracoccidioides brasiliensis Pb03]
MNGGTSPVPNYPFWVRNLTSQVQKIRKRVSRRDCKTKNGYKGMRDMDITQTRKRMETRKQGEQIGEQETLMS